MRKEVEGNPSLVGYDAVGPWSRPAKACRPPPTFFAFRVPRLKGKPPRSFEANDGEPLASSGKRGTAFKEKCFLETEPSTFNRTKYAPLRIHLPEVPP
jgi:hypothetical protein